MASVDAKPRITVLATGGTIAGRANSAAATAGYKAGVLTVEELINSAPPIKDFARLRAEQIANIDSKDMTGEIWLKLAQRINELADNNDADGFVITHGTDTMEETVYFLNLTVKTNKPVVLTGAMRPATSLGADGAMNLLKAVRVAADTNAVGKGCMVVMNDEIHAARDVIKFDTQNAAAFKSPLVGLLGRIDNGVVDFYREARKIHTVKTEFDTKNVTKLPKVYIICGHADDDGALVKAATEIGAKGIVYAGTGNGSVHFAAEKVLAQAAKSGVAVIRATRVPIGAVIPAEQSYIDAGFIDSGTLSPQKARILLQLALLKTADFDKIKEMFGKY